MDEVKELILDICNSYDKVILSRQNGDDDAVQLNFGVMSKSVIDLKNLLFDLVPSEYKKIPRGFIFHFFHPNANEFSDPRVIHKPVAGLCDDIHNCILSIRENDPNFWYLSVALINKTRGKNLERELFSVEDLIKNS